MIEEKILDIAAKLKDVNLEKENLGQEIIHQINQLIMYMDILGIPIRDLDCPKMRLHDLLFDDRTGEFFFQTQED